MFFFFFLFNSYNRNTFGQVLFELRYIFNSLLYLKIPTVSESWDIVLYC